MKDILKMLNLDFETAKALCFTEIIFVALLLTALCMFLTPVISVYLTIISIILIVPMRGMEEKYELNKLYGILPVKRRNVTRARFIFIFITFFTSEIVEVIIAFISKSLKLNRFLPNQDNTFMQMISNGFNNFQLPLFIIMGAFTLCCLLFCYMEMVSKIFGSENEMKSVIILIGSVSVLLVTFLMLSQKDIIPTFHLPSLPETTQGMLLLGAVVNAIILGICLVMGEITARVLEKREI